jgi:hypothetical protein
LEEKERRLNDLERQIVLESALSSESDNVRYHKIIEEKDKILEELQKEVVLLEQESYRREIESAVIAKVTMESTYEHEKNTLIQLIKGKNIRIDELMQEVSSLEQKFTSSLTAFSSQLAEKQAEIKLIQDACEKIVASQILAALEIEEKKLMVEELEEEIHAIQQKLKLQEEKWIKSEQLALDTEVQLGAKQLQVKQMNDQMENNLRNSEALLQKLSSERDYLLAFVQELSDKIFEFSNADTKLMDMLRSISAENDCPVMNLKRDDGFHVTENMLIHSPTRIKKLEAISDTRSPFKELNS